MGIPSRFTKWHGSLGRRCGLLSNYFDLLLLLLLLLYSSRIALYRRNKVRYRQKSVYVYTPETETMIFDAFDDRLCVLPDECVDRRRVRSGCYVHLVHNLADAAADSGFLFLVGTCLTQTFVVEAVRG